MAFRSLSLVVALIFSLLFLGCGLLGFGGGDNASQDMEIIEFFDEVPTPEVEEVVARALTVDPEVLVAVHFLYDFQVRLEGLAQVVRDLSSMLDYSGPADVDLDWVAEVHEVTREADDYFRVLTSLRVPESQREQYEYLYVGMLEAVQISGYGADRLLAAAVVVGPAGRSMLNMSVDEVDEFETLVRESRFFLSDALERVESNMTEVGRVISSLSLR